MKDNPKLYEINTVAWLYELSRQYGNKINIGNVPTEQWDRLKDLGFDCVWLMGVWKRSKEGIRIFRTGTEWRSFQELFDSVLPGWTDDDIVGSPYSIASYSPDPMVGSWEDMGKVREELHGRSMKLILDFVPNHTAPDHPWIFEHPDFYFQGSDSDVKENQLLFSRIQNGKKVLNVARGKDPFFPPWSDTAQLNYFNPHMRSAMILELKRIADCCDGVRCDMAMLVLNDIFDKNWEWAKKKIPYERPAREFWHEVRDAVPGFLLIAETYWETESQLQHLGFDYVYDKKLYDRLRSFSPHDVVLHLKADVSFQKKLVRFIENHDELRSADIFSGKRSLAAATLFSTLPGMKLYHHGQLEGKKVRVPMQLRRVSHEEPNQELKAFHERLLYITKKDLFYDGEWQLKEVASAGDDNFRNLIAHRWKAKNHLKLIVVNLSQDYSQGRISLKNEISGEMAYIVNDELNDQRYVRKGKDMANPGLHVILEGWQSHVFDISPKL